MATDNTRTDADSRGTASATDDGSRRFVPLLGRFFPESFGLAVLLALAALLATAPSLGVESQLELFATGFYDLFTLQMALILLWVLSANVVESRPVGALLDRIAAAVPTSQRAIVAATAAIAMAFGLINWALGLVGGVLVGHRLCRRAREAGVAVHYPLVLTGALLSLVVTNQGLSSPGALLMADESGTTNFLVESAGSVTASSVLLSPANVVASLVLLATLPPILVALAPGDESDRTELAEVESLVSEAGSAAGTLDRYEPPEADRTFADRLEQSRLISLTAVVIGAASVGWHFATGGRLTLLWFLFALVVLGLLVHGQPMAFREKTTHATRWANHLAIPFLLYATVVALLSEAGLYVAIGDALGAAAAGAFAAAFGVGLLVPDPGAVWTLLGPALVAAGADLADSIVAVMFGAGLSNLWLGFLFVAVVGVRGFAWREFARYAAVVTVYVAAVVIASVTLL